MRKFPPIIIFTLALILILSACSDPTPTPFPVTEIYPAAVEPTQSPATAAPLEAAPTRIPPTELPPTLTPPPVETSVPASPFDSMKHTPDPLLTNTIWEWIQRDPNGNQMGEITVPNSESYTLTFNEDGTFQAQLDCNSSNGRYATESPDSIFMELGASTLAFCGDNSLDSAMSMIFGPAQTYRLEENGSILALSWVAGGPIDYFRNAEVAANNPDLIDKTWQWNGLTSSILDITIQAPEKYLIQFNEDGSIDLQADCNLLQATYSTLGSSLNIDLRPENTATTLAACPDGALYELYLLGLDTAQSYVLQGDSLALELGKNDGIMHFAEAGTEITESSDESEISPPSQPAPATGDFTGIVNAPDGINMREGPGTEYPTLGIIPDATSLIIVGVSQDREWWVIENPDQPDETAWVSRNFVETAVAVRDLPTVATPEIEPTLLDYPWQWHSLTTPLESTTVSDPTLYTIQFNANGTAVIRADCNTATASYTSDENAINVNMGLTTLVACPGDSLDALYLNTLTDVTTFFFEAGDLYLEMPVDSGTMRFIPDRPPQPETPETPEATPTASAETGGDYFKVVSFGEAGSEQAVLAGTELTAIITETEIKGSAGCNDYSGGLNRTEDTFTISSIVVTEKTCAEPAGIMEQEEAYLAALADTGAFSWEEQFAEDGSVVTAGQFFYVAGGVNGIINLISS